MSLKTFRIPHFGKIAVTNVEGFPVIGFYCCVFAPTDLWPLEPGFWRVAREGHADVLPLSWEECITCGHIECDLLPDNMFVHKSLLHRLLSVLTLLLRACKCQKMSQEGFGPKSHLWKWPSRCLNWFKNVQCLWCLQWQGRSSFNYIVMKLRSDQCLFCFVLALTVCVGRKNKNIVRLYLE